MKVQVHVCNTMNGNTPLITTRYAAETHLLVAIAPALASAHLDWNRDIAAIGEPMLGNEVFVDDHRFWQFSFTGGPIVESRPFQWLTEDGQLIFTQHGPPDNDVDPPEVFDAEIRAGRQALGESGEAVVVVPVPLLEGQS
jgi:hypothetical protein